MALTRRDTKLDTKDDMFMCRPSPPHNAVNDSWSCKSDDLLGAEHIIFM